jgi:L-2-hydroxyglutarate oxidase LhgO
MNTYVTAANGVENLHMLDGGEATRMEPALACAAALHSPETGIIDSHGYMLALPADHGLPGLVHLFGIESPGLTASLSLAEEVVAKLTA